MYARSLTSASGALLITAGLLLIMQFLIVTGEAIVGDTRVRHNLTLTKVRDEQALEPRETPPARPSKPLTPPPSARRGPTPELGPGVHIPSPPSPGTGTTITAISYGDGPLFNIFKVSPTYPVAALSRGLEGTVLVQYDVTADGQVANVVVLDSSHSIFNKAAIAAAYRFKYKPHTVDGVTYETRGLQNLFRFKLEE